MTSPEIALSKRFNEYVLRHPQFYNRLCLLAIDECHLVEDWKKFRPDYSVLGILRARIPDPVPLLGLTATLDPQLMHSILQACDFRDDVNIIRTPLDRPEIFIQCSVMTRSMSGMLDLQHVLPASIQRPQDIPKTIIFMESIAQVLRAYELMKKWMALLGYQVPIAPIVQPFFSAMAEDDKKRVLKGFSEPSNMCQSPRIIIATEAYGLGIDNPDISRVIQWGVPSSVSRLNQRMGRAMRSRKGQGHFLFLFPPVMVGPLEAASGENKKKQAQAESRSRLCRTLWRLMNEKSPVCLRKIGLQHFDAIDMDAAGEVGRLCCNNCNPESKISLKVHPELNVTLERNSLRQPWYHEKLESWRTKKANETFQGFVLIEPSSILPTAVLEKLANHGDLVRDLRSLKALVGLGRGEISEFGSEILAIFLEGQALAVEEDEVYNAWVDKNNVKRKRVKVQPVNARRLEFDDERAAWLKTNQGTKAGSSGIGNKKRNKTTDGQMEANSSILPRPTSADIENALGLNNKTKLVSINSKQPAAKSQRAKQISLKTAVPAIAPPTLSPTKSRSNRRMPARYAE